MSEIAIRVSEIAICVPSGQEFGCPRLLDAADVYRSDEATESNPRDVDARSLQTYVLKLRQALRRHAERSLVEAATRLVAMEAQSAQLAAWASEVAEKFARQKSESTATRAKATTPAERKAAIGDAEATHATLEAHRAGADKAVRLATKMAIEKVRTPLEGGRPATEPGLEPKTL